MSSIKLYYNIEIFLQAYLIMKFTKLLKRTAQCGLTVLNQLGLPVIKYGYYVPYPYARDLATPARLYPLKNISALLENNLENFKKNIAEAEQYNTNFENFHKGTKTDPLAPRFNQDWFCGIDGAVAYALVRNIKPQTVIEVGCGFSTRFLARAVKDGGLNTKIYGINPKILCAADKLCDTFYNCTLDKAPAELFDNLRAGDILFVDASHLFMPGTDLELLFLDILPKLPKGVYIHLHDIFLPQNYPNDPDWNWWAFNEQQLLAVLLSGGAYKPVFASAYVRAKHPQMLSALLAPLHPRGLESSFWFIKQF